MQTIFGNTSKLQFNAAGKLQHLLDIDGLNRTLIEEILNTANTFISQKDLSIKKVPLLKGQIVANLFFEPSTRTRTTFEIAANKLSADILNLDINTSATSKGESLLDTIKNLEAMQVNMFVLRHRESGAAHFIAQHVAPHTCVINAGDGCHAHPSQALLDMLTIQRHKTYFDTLTVVIVGDINHSRVARSQISALYLLGCRDIRLVGPKTLTVDYMNTDGVRVYSNFDQALEDADVIIMLRLQQERMQSALLPSKREFFKLYGLTSARVKKAKPDAIVMHPGPTNRGTEIAAEVADSPQSVILEQVSLGIATRMAIMVMCLSANKGAKAH